MQDKLFLGPHSALDLLGAKAIGPGRPEQTERHGQYVRVVVADVEQVGGCNCAQRDPRVVVREEIFRRIRPGDPWTSRCSNVCAVSCQFTRDSCKPRHKPLCHTCTYRRRVRPTEARGRNFLTAAPCVRALLGPERCIPLHMPTRVVRAVDLRPRKREEGVQKALSDRGVVLSWDAPNSTNFGFKL